MRNLGARGHVRIEKLKISIFDNLHVHVVINGVFSVIRILWRVAGISIKHSLFEDSQR